MFGSLFLKLRVSNCCYPTWHPARIFSQYLIVTRLVNFRARSSSSKHYIISLYIELLCRNFCCFQFLRLIHLQKWYAPGLTLQNQRWFCRTRVDSPKQGLNLQNQGWLYRTGVDFAEPGLTLQNQGWCYKTRVDFTEPGLIVTNSWKCFSIFQGLAPFTNFGNFYIDHHSIS